MPRSDHESSVEKLLNAIRLHAAKINEYYAALKTLSEFDETIILPDLSTLIKSEGQIISHVPDRAIRPDEFVGMPIPAAIEKFLQKIGHAISFDEIYDALGQGGVEFTSNGRTVLANAIRRSDDKFTKIKNGHIGLREWYGKKRSSVKDIIEKANAAIEKSKEKEEKDATPSE